ncbi:hypothetical protein M0R04_07745 [Candidatus Dojkabacteria bacterium]|jgi:hypothetical protein|nr:hypothetical protein [Candidatus Dojkabacteria bacterium]
MLEPVTGFIVGLTAAITIVADCVPKIIAAAVIILSGLSTASGAITTVWKQPKGKGILTKIHKFINFMAWNFGHATNKNIDSGGV